MIRNRNLIILFASVIVFLMVILLTGLFNSKDKDDILTTSEKNWLSEKQEIIFVSQTSYPPFEFIDETGNRQGMCIELANWMAAEFGFRTSFIDMSFQDAQNAILEGKADVLTSLFFSEKRDEIFDFSTVLWDIPASIFVKAERPDIVGMEDLNGKKVAIQSGDYAKRFSRFKRDKI